MIATGLVIYVFVTVLIFVYYLYTTYLQLPHWTKEIECDYIQWVNLNSMMNKKRIPILGTKDEWKMVIKLLNAQKI